MKVNIALAGAPLPESRQPINTDVKHISHHINAIDLIAKGFVKAAVVQEETGAKDKHAIKVTLSSHAGVAEIEFSTEDKYDYWQYNGFSRVNNETLYYKGETAHHSDQSIVRKIRSLAMKLR